MKLTQLKYNRFYRLYMTLFRVNTRNRTAFFFSMIFPLVFMAVFGVAFQEGDPANTTISLAMINQDNGVPDGAQLFDLSGNQLSSISPQFLEILEDITFEDNETKIFDVTVYDDYDEALNKVERQIHKALLVIPQDFTLGYMAAVRASFDTGSGGFDGYPSANYTANVELVGDSTLIAYNIASAVVSEVVDRYFALGAEDVGATVQLTSSIESEGFSTFDFVVPGLVIFAIIANANTVAAISLNDVESQMLARLRLTRMKGYEYPTALVLSQITMSFLQIPILFGSAMLFGFPFSTSIGLAFVFAIFVSIAMTGVGLIFASFVKDANSVGALAAAVTTPMSFLAGAFFVIPNPTLFAEGVIGDQAFGVFDLLPPTRAINALRLVLFNDYSVVQVLPDFLITVVLAALYLTIGIVLYTRKHLRAQ